MVNNLIISCFHRVENKLGELKIRLLESIECPKQIHLLSDLLTDKKLL